MLSSHLDDAFNTWGWQPEVLAALDDRHLVAWARDASRRTRFAAELQRFLGTQPGAELVVLHGRTILGLDHFCDQLERQLPGPRLERRLDGADSVTELLRDCQPLPGQRAAKARYYLWNDADVLLRSDPTLFGGLVDTILGVAAEAEFGSGELLTIHRAVFTGGPMLENYARDARGQFNRWAPDGTGEPFWQLVSGLDRPPVLSSPVDNLMQRPRRAMA